MECECKQILLFQFQLFEKSRGTFINEIFSRFLKCESIDNEIIKGSREAQGLEKPIIISSSKDRGMK